MEDTWLRVAKGLKLGQTRRVTCCGNDNSMIVSVSERGWSAYCFRCTETLYERRPDQNLATQLRMQNERTYLASTVNSRSVSLPTDFTLDIPMGKSLWLLKAGVHMALARKYSVGYSAMLDRIVLPVYWHGTLVAIQARSLNSSVRPKYLNTSGVPIRTVLYNSIRMQKARRGVIVEDILSCIRIGEVTPATSILGTTMTDERCLALSRQYEHVDIWMDPDTAGAKGLAAARKQLAFQGVTSTQIHTTKDPKFYSNREIREILHGVR